MTPAQQLEALERERIAALVARDLAAVARLHAPDYQLVTPAGRTLGRDRYLALLAEAPFYADWRAGPMQVHVDAGLAALRYRATLVFPSGRAREVWHTDLWRRGPAGWQAWWSQATEIAPADGAAVAAGADEPQRAG
ncbi:nuclear transport factor 2 family protein [Piscinibacter sakaiensis]|uniref:DUF4440 domain-containing protein n=1 Tax=Piscinibacter sakaiensis TaxID=1547922 RepID=A0A0K8P4R7_PISS1|nr:nuclear transport factor 2 family protein [Piscinibacter sakaiensis]GAP37616.1 hypothetical protein ISF6_3561 [Piscinibacter sakaiensis]